MGFLDKKELNNLMKNLNPSDKYYYRKKNYVSTIKTCRLSSFIASSISALMILITTVAYFKSYKELFEEFGIIINLSSDEFLYISFIVGIFIVNYRIYWQQLNSAKESLSILLDEEKKELQITIINEKSDDLNDLQEDNNEIQCSTGNLSTVNKPSLTLKFTKDLILMLIFGFVIVSYGLISVGACLVITKFAETICIFLNLSIESGSLFQGIVIIITFISASLGRIFIKLHSAIFNEYKNKLEIYIKIK